MAQAVAVVPSRQKTFYAATSEGGTNVGGPNKVIQWLLRQVDPLVVCTMGGPAQTLYERIVQTGIPVHRIPWHTLHGFSGIEKGAPAHEYTSALLLAWEAEPGAFYPFGEMDPDILLIQSLARHRLSIQAEIRKRVQLQLHAMLRDVEFLLPPSPELRTLVKTIKAAITKSFPETQVRKVEAGFDLLIQQAGLTASQRARTIAIRKLFTSPAMVKAAKEEEESLEASIRILARPLPIWQALHPPQDSVLPRILGLGPALGGAIIGEIGSILRFPSSNKLRAYARFHVAPDGSFPHRRKGEVSPWGRFLSQAVWLWSADQVMRYDHPWKQLYLVYKAQELQRHPEVIPVEATNSRGRKYTRYDFVLEHCHTRAARKVGSALLEYIWGLWTALEERQDLSTWYQNSRWPDLFQRTQESLEENLQAYLDEEIPKRRRASPKEELGEEGEEIEEE